MPSGLTYQDVVFTQGGTNVGAAVDASMAAESVPRRVADFHGYSFNVSWVGSPSGALSLRLCNASVNMDKLVPPANWVTIPSLTLTIGGSTGASSPSLIEVTFGRAGWVSLLWTPTGGSGTIGVKFDGVRR